MVIRMVAGPPPQRKVMVPPRPARSRDWCRRVPAYPCRSGQPSAAAGTAFRAAAQARQRNAWRAISRGRAFRVLRIAEIPNDGLEVSRLSMTRSTISLSGRNDEVAA